MRTSARTTVGPGGDTIRLNEAINNLTRQVTGVANAWEGGLKAPLEVLYTIESQPEYRLAVLREEALQSQYRDNLRKFADLTNHVAPGGAVSIVSAGSSGNPIKILGVKKEYILIAGGGVGVLLGWLVANLADRLIGSRARRRSETTSTEDPSA